MYYATSISRVYRAALHPHMNLEQARHNMIEQQLRPSEVLDQRVLDVFSEVQREDFVPGRYRQLAFADTAIPLGHGEAMMPPRLEARMVQSLTVGADDRVLEIGTGSGYVTAVLAHLARHVISVDIYADFTVEARSRLAARRVTDVSLETGDARLGWPVAAPYDVIAVTGSLIEVHEALLRQLAPGGRMFAVVGEPPTMEARLITRVGDREWSSEALFETSLPPLVGERRTVPFSL